MLCNPPFIRFRMVLFVLICGMSPLLAGAEPAGDQPPDFGRDVRPILSEACFHCHGPSEASREAGLRLDVAEEATADRDGDPAIVPGHPEESLVFERLLSDDPHERMPPAESEKKITPEQIEVLRRWIASGAKYEEHWSMVVPKRADPPAVKQQAWPQNPIDHFVLARLEANGMTPAVEADRPTLIRRLSLDLRGLPPTLEEVDQFVQDRSPDAYERLVDRMLASKHFGERMAVLWMDLARYGDTNGYHYDSTRQVWLWRDWVINAYNQNMPFDQFTIEQLAGDLIPDATIQQRVASGFNRNTRFNEEGGADPQEFRARYAVDRTNTLGQVWLGLTLGCAECHSHKYDPITQKEYYQLFAFFNSLDEPGAQGHNKRYEPTIAVPQPEQTKQIDAASTEIARVEAQISDKLEEISYSEPDLPSVRLETPQAFVWIDDALPAGAQGQGGTLDWIDASEGPVFSGKRSLRRVARGTQQYYFGDTPQRLTVAEGDVLVAHVYLDPNDTPDEIMVQFNGTGESAGWRHRAYWGQNRIAFGRDNTTERKRLGDLPATGEWVRLEVPAAEVGLMPGMQVHGWAVTQYNGTAYWDQLGIVSSLPQGPQDVVWIDDDVPSQAKLNGNGQNPNWHWVGGAGHQVHGGLRSMRRSASGLNQHYFTGAAPGLTVRTSDVLFAYVYLDPADPPQAVQLQFNDGNWEHRVSWGKPNVTHGANRPGGANYHAGPLPAVGSWVRLEVPIEKVGLADNAKLNGWAFTQRDGTVYYDTAGVRTWQSAASVNTEVSQAAWEQVAKADKSLPEPVRVALKVAEDDRAPVEKKAVQDHYLRYVYGPSREIFDPLNQRITSLRDKIAKVRRQIPFQLVSVELKKPRPTHVLIRGDFQQLGEQVEPEVPAVFPHLPADQPRNRLGLAHWLSNPGNPLVARVQVNRFWAQLFGEGIVRTVGDFGSQGRFPSHPQLLDWLATEFVGSGWDVKHVFKTIVTSATYRQSSIASTSYADHDPDNELLWKSPRVRLQAEVIRDNALSIAGMLSYQIGGPPVFPYQPDGYYLGKAPGGMKSRWPWNVSGGENLYRRGLYTFWRRTTPYPTFIIFDAPDRSECTVIRPRTNSPLQALASLNDPQFVEAARVMAQRVIRESSADTDARIKHAFRLALARPPAERELNILRTSLEKRLARYEADPQAAQALAKAGRFARPAKLDPVQHAVWTSLCTAILNLDETITRE